MIEITEKVSMLPFNSFGVEATARRFCRITNPDQLPELIATRGDGPLMILGEGSNVLFTGDFPGLVAKAEIRGIDIVDETDERVLVKAGAGESWHGLVMFCVDQAWGGLENLSLIPGTVGAAPIQNIGAYGVEIQDRVENVAGVDLTTGNSVRFNRDECKFEYRESVFKHALKEKIFISSVTLSLTKKNHHFTTGYEAIRETLREHKVESEKDFTVKAISDAVIAIRKRKLPDTSVAGSAGSFFKNPTVTSEQAEAIKKEFPEMPSYHAVNQKVKVPAGWLIEQCGWKGKRLNNVGVYPMQALVLVNYGGGTGEEIFQLAMNIRESVQQKFGILLETEVNII